MSGLVGIPCAEHGRYSAFWASVAGLDLPTGWRVFQGQGSSIAANRNGIVRQALKEGKDYVLFLDDDLLVPRDLLTILLSTEREAVVALSFRRHPKFDPLWFHTFQTTGDIALSRDELPGPGTLVPLAWATMGGVLLSTSVFARMDDPWFTIGQHGADALNEDFDFFLKLHAAGVQLFGCSSAVCGHTTTMDVWPSREADGRWVTVLARGHQVFAKIVDAPVAMAQEPLLCEPVTL